MDTTQNIGDAADRTWRADHRSEPFMCAALAARTRQTVHTLVEVDVEME